MKSLCLILLLLLTAVAAHAQQEISVAGGPQMELYDEYSVSAAGIVISYYSNMSSTVRFGGSIGITGTKGDNWYVPVSTGLSYRPFEKGVSPLMGLEVGTAYISQAGTLREPVLIAPYVGAYFPINDRLDANAGIRANILTRNGNWWGYLGFNVGASYSL